MSDPLDGDDPLLGRVVSHYRIAERLGAGGMGSVYVAEDQTLGRRVALKAIRHDHRDSQQLRQRFQREARLLSRLDHPNICRIYDYIGGDDEDFLILELIEGGTLKEYAAGGLELPDVLRVVNSIAEALVAAHGQQIVHRDLKPANVMVTTDGVVKVLDFGLARPTGPLDGAQAPPEPEEVGPDPEASSSWSSVEMTLTEEGRVTGTLRYMSPEQARAETLTTASDIFSLGLIFQELLTGERAYPTGLLPYELWELCKEGRSTPFETRDGQLFDLLTSMKALAPSERPTALDVVHLVERLRTRPRRRLLQGIGAAALLLVAGGVTKYVVDLGQARDVADGRRRQAEGLLEQVILELHPKLDRLGQLELLSDLGAAAQGYYEAVPSDSLSENERLRRSRVLYQIGELRRDLGDLDAACKLYEQSLEVVQNVRPDAEGYLDWLWNLGQAQFYVGYGLYDQLDPRAELWFDRYLETAQRGYELSNGEERWWVEVAYATSTLGSQAIEQECVPSVAIGHFEQSVDVWRALRAESPEDPNLRLELADALSWLGRAHTFQATYYSDYERSVELLREELELRRDLVAEFPTDMLHLSRLATAYNSLGGAERGRCRPLEARNLHEEGRALARMLFERDPEDADARHELATACLVNGRLQLALGDFRGARSEFLEAREHTEHLVDAAPGNRLWSDTLRFVDDGLNEVEQRASYLGLDSSSEPK